MPKSGFTGPVGKFLHQVNSLHRNFDFVSLTDTEPLIQFSENVIKICQLTSIPVIAVDKLC